MFEGLDVVVVIEFNCLVYFMRLFNILRHLLLDATQLKGQRYNRESEKDNTNLANIAYLIIFTDYIAGIWR